MFTDLAKENGFRLGSSSLRKTKKSRRIRKFYSGCDNVRTCETYLYIRQSKALAYVSLKPPSPGAGCSRRTSWTRQRWRRSGTWWKSSAHSPSPSIFRSVWTEDYSVADQELTLRILYSVRVGTRSDSWILPSGCIEDKNRLIPLIYVEKLWKRLSKGEKKS